MWGNNFCIVLLFKYHTGKNMKFEKCAADRNIQEASWRVLLRHKLVHWLYGITCWLLEVFKESLFARYILFTYHFLLWKCCLLFNGCTKAASLPLSFLYGYWDIMHKITIFPYDTLLRVDTHFKKTKVQVCC
jgi:hypothetical protein